MNVASGYSGTESSCMRDSSEDKIQKPVRFNGVLDYDAEGMRLAVVEEELVSTWSKPIWYSYQ